MKHLLPIAFFWMPLLSSCCKSVLSPHQQLVLQTEGYQDQDLDTLLVSKYTYGSNYSNLVLTDTFLAKDINNFDVYGSGDSHLLPIDFESAFEWKITLPATGQAITLKDFVYDAQSHEVCKIYLGGLRENYYSPMVSAIVNNVDSLFNNEDPVVALHK